MPEQTRDQVFISYSRKDKLWKEKLRKTLSPMVRNGSIKVWADTDIRPGGNWKDEIDKALRSTKVAVLLVTPDFLSSDFITTYELPEILKATTEGVTLMWVAVRSSNYRETVLAPYQAANDSEKPLASLKTHKAEEELVRICERIKAAVESNELSVPIASQQIWNIPFFRNLNFTGRHELLNQLSLINSTSTRSVSAITGMAGVGKSQTAIEYAYQYRDRYRVVWWLRADESASLALDYASLAERLALPEKDASEQHYKVEAVKRWLEQNSHWLLIFDNAKDNSLIRSYLPQGHNGHVLITSRNPSWGNLARPITVPLLTQSESLGFLLQRTDSDDETSAIALAEALSYLPLALEQAGAYVEETGRTLSSYLELFRTNRSVLLGRESQTSEHQSVAATWSLSLEELKKQSQASVDLMNLFAFFAPDNIPLKFIGEEAHPNHQTDVPGSLSNVIGQPLALDDAVLHLKKYSLVSIKDGNASIHRLVQTLVRDQLNDDDKKKYFKLAVGLMNCAFPKQSKDVATWPKADTLVPHVLRAFEEASVLKVKWRQLAILINEVGGYLSKRAEYEKAREMYESALGIVEAVSGPNSDDAIAVLGGLGNVLEDLGDLEKAQAVLERALEIAETNYGPDDPKVGTPCHNLGSLLRKRGKLDEAKPLLERSFDLTLSTDSPDPEDIIIRASALAGLCTALNDLETAGALYAVGLEIARNLYQPDDLRLVEPVSNQGTFFAEQGDYQKAVPLLEEALRIAEVCYGEDHPLLVTIHGNLAQALIGAGDKAKARVHHEKALQIAEAKLDANHPDLANPLNNLGAALCENHELAKGLALLHRALQIAEQNFGNTHKITATIKGNLALYEDDFAGEFFDSGDYAEALTHLSIALDMKPSFSAYSHRGRIYFLTENYEAAESDLTNALALDPEASDLYGLRARIYVSLGNLEAAKSDLEKALEFNPNDGELRFLKGYFSYSQKKFAEALPDLLLATELLPDKLKAFRLLGRTYYETGDFTSALNTLTNAISLNPGNGFSHHWRGAAHYERKEFDQALSDFLQAQELGFENPHNARFIGQTNYYLANHAAAIPYLTKAIEAFPDRAELYHWRGACFGAQEQFETALPDFTKAIELDPNAAFLYDWRGQAHGRLQNFPAALSDLNRAIDLDPSNAHYHQVRGQIRNRLGDDKDALKDFDTALQLEPDDVNHRDWRAVTHFHLRHYQAAVDDFSIALESQPTKGWLYQFCGMAQQELGNYAIALDNLTKAIDLLPDDKTIYIARAKCHLAFGDYRATLEDLNSCKEHRQEYAPVEFWRAVTKLASGDEISGRECLDEAWRLAQDDADVDQGQLISARVALLRRQQDEAMTIYSDVSSGCFVRKILAELSVLDLLQRLFPDNQQIAVIRAFLETKLSSPDSSHPNSEAK